MTPSNKPFAKDDRQVSVPRRLAIAPLLLALLLVAFPVSAQDFTVNLK